MLHQLDVENFKAFRQLSLPLRPLTLLSGLNGMGKSTVLQVMLLLRQNAWIENLEYGRGIQDVIYDSEGEPTYIGKDWFSSANSAPVLLINGDYVQLGTAYDIFSRDAATDELKIRIVSDGYFADNIDGYSVTNTQRSIKLEAQFVFIYNASDNTLRIASTSAYPSEHYDHVVPHSLESLLRGQNVHYLSADRIAPQTTFALNEETVRRHQIGNRGEYTAHFLHYWSLQAETLFKVPEILQHGSSQSTNIITQVAAWMSEISPGTKIDTQPIEGTDFIRLRFGHDSSDFFRPTNVGYGLTYTLPVVTTLVAAQPGALILLENPEAHLHPYGQSQIAALIARAAHAGAQVIVETHSDHILNGIRIAARKGLIDAQEVALHYFQRGKDPDAGSEVVSPALSQQGRLDFWPEGFFDEWDNSLDELM